MAAWTAVSAAPTARHVAVFSAPRAAVENSRAYVPAVIVELDVMVTVWTSGMRRAKRLVPVSELNATDTSCTSLIAAAVVVTSWTSS
eukprot:4377311-Prorocentrum_lima.AAC.1